VAYRVVRHPAAIVLGQQSRRLEMTSESKDFFISYTSADLRWAEWIADQLEGAGYSTVLQAWDFRPGDNFVVRMSQALIAAERVLAVFSSAYFDSAYATDEWTAALVRAEHAIDRLLPVRVERCRIPPLVANRVYIDLVGLDEPAAEASLLAGISKGRGKPPGKRPFPGAKATAGSPFPPQHLSAPDRDGVPRALGHHDGMVTSVDLSMDGNLLITVGTDLTARIWDRRTGNERQVLRHHSPVTSGLFSPDGRRVATVSGKNVHIWDSSSGVELQRLGQTADVYAIAYSPDGRALAIVGNYAMSKLVDSRSGVELRRFAHGLRATSLYIEILAVAISRDGVMMATAIGTGTARVWDLHNGKEITRIKHGFPNYIRTIAFSPDGRLLATGSEDKTARTWYSKSGQALQQFPHPGPVQAVAFCPERSWLATACGDRFARVWHLESGEDIATFHHDHNVSCVAFSSDGTLLATNGGNNAAILWSLS
jgi:hypothetical protein